MKHLEHEHQKALMLWAKWTYLPAADDVEQNRTVGDYLFAIPNGGSRNAREGARMKLEGVKPGVSDLFLALPRQGLAGLWIEMKAPKKRASAAQQEWFDRMKQAGYEAICCDDWTKAACAIVKYAGLPDL